MNPEINDHARSSPSYRNCTISFLPTVTALEIEWNEEPNVPTTIAVLRSIAKHRCRFLYIYNLGDNSSIDIFSEAMK